MKQNTELSAVFLWNEMETNYTFIWLISIPCTSFQHCTSTAWMSTLISHIFISMEVMSFMKMSVFLTKKKFTVDIHNPDNDKNSIKIIFNGMSMAWSYIHRDDDDKPRMVLKSINSVLCMCSQWIFFWMNFILVRVG